MTNFAQSGEPTRAPVNDPSKTETKTLAATWASFLVSTAGLWVLGYLGTDFIADLPDIVEAPVYALVVSVGTWLAARQTKHAPQRMSKSALQALEILRAQGRR